MAVIQNKLLTGTITVIHLEKEVFVIKNTRNIKGNIEKSSKIAPLDCFFCSLYKVHVPILDTQQNESKQKQIKSFSQKAVTVHPICSNFDALDKMKIYIFLVCCKQYIKNF